MAIRVFFVLTQEFSPTKYPGIYLLKTSVGDQEVEMDPARTDVGYVSFSDPLMLRLPFWLKHFDIIESSIREETSADIWPGAYDFVPSLKKDEPSVNCEVTLDSPTKRTVRITGKTPTAVCAAYRMLLEGSVQPSRKYIGHTGVMLPTLDQVEKEYLHRVLTHAKGDLQTARETMRITLTTLEEMLRRHSLKPEAYKPKSS